MLRKSWLAIKMGCVNSQQIKPPKKALPPTPQHQASFHNTNNPTIPSSTLQHPNGQPQERSNSLSTTRMEDSFVSNGNTTMQPSSPPTTTSQDPSSSTLKGGSTKSKSKGFFGTFGKRSSKPTMEREMSVASNVSGQSGPQAQQQGTPQRGYNVPLPTPPTNTQNNSGSKQSPAQKVVIALYPYEGRDDGELSFEKNDKLVVVDDNEPDWWLAYKLTIPERRGYIPMNFVVNNIIETEEWFFSKTSRRAAERLLLEGDYPRGTFLIRNSEQDSGSLLGAFSLSIRDFDSMKLDHVKHYKIQTKPNGDFFITSRRSFVKLQDLIEHYAASANGLCYRLTKPCPKVSLHGAQNPRIVGGEIDRRDLKFIRELGSGNFGKVFFGLYRGGMKVAVKTLKPGTMTPTAFLQEAAIMRRYRHDKLVPLFGVCSIGLPLLIVTEFMCKGALLNYLRDNPESATLTIMDLIDMSAQVASGMAFLEKVKLVHRDLAARNCLVGEKRVVKVADFGLARIIEEDYYVAQVGAKFPIKWTAPEAASKGKFTSKSDVWSFGILLYEIVTKGGLPYPGMTNRDVLEQVERGYRMPKPKNVECPNSIYSMMLNCWDKDPDKRPTFEYLYSYFDDFFVANEPRYRDAEDFHSGAAGNPDSNLYDKMVK